MRGSIYRERLLLPIKVSFIKLGLTTLQRLITLLNFRRNAQIFTLVDPKSSR